MSVHATNALAEADRLMTICNACRYCEGLCAVFPAMELRRDFLDGDLNYIANLCHGCGACFSDCQFSPPHEFAVNVPLTLATVRAESYRQYAWPAAFRGMFDRNGLAISVVVALSVAVFILAFVARQAPAALFAAGDEAGAFYRVMPHAAMAGLFSAATLFAVVALVMGFRQFWRDIGARQVSTVSIGQALRDAASLRYLDGGGVGCVNEGEEPGDSRRLFHHLTFYGFLSCFVSTSVATLYHYLLGLEAPYAWYDLPVLFGTFGGIAIVVGCIGLMRAKLTRNPQLLDEARLGMDTAFIAMLLLTAGTGLALLLVRATPAMGLTLAVHLGVVFAFFVTAPYSKFVHGLYRFGALLWFAIERRIKTATAE